MVKDNLELKKPASTQDMSQKNAFGYGVITNSSIISKSVAGPPESCTSSCSPPSCACWGSCTPTTACIGPGSDELRKVKVLRQNLFSQK